MAAVGPHAGAPARHNTAAAAVGDTVYIPGGGDRAGGAPLDVNDAYRPASR